MAAEETQHAELFYDAIADTAPSPPVRDFFREVARNEAEHVRAVAALIDKHEKR